MTKLGVADNREGLAFATKLQLLAIEDAPDVFTETAVQRLVTRLRRQYGTSPRLKRAQLLQYLQSPEGPTTISFAEIRDHFGWPQPKVSILINEILTEQSSPIEIVAEQMLPGPRGGRPSTRIRLKTR